MTLSRGSSHGERTHENQSLGVNYSLPCRPSRARVRMNLSVHVSAVVCVRSGCVVASVSHVAAELLHAPEAAGLDVLPVVREGVACGGTPTH